MSNPWPPYKGPRNVYAYRFINLCPPGLQHCRCAELHGIVVDHTTYDTRELRPPLHQLCVCAWEVILVDDPDKPEITGVPVTLM